MGIQRDGVAAQLAGPHCVSRALRSGLLGFAPRPSGRRRRRWHSSVNSHLIGRRHFSAPRGDIIERHILVSKPCRSFLFSKKRMVDLSHESSRVYLGVVLLSRQKTRRRL